MRIYQTTVHIGPKPIALAGVLSSLKGFFFFDSAKYQRRAKSILAIDPQDQLIKGSWEQFRQFSALHENCLMAGTIDYTAKCQFYAYEAWIEYHHQRHQYQICSLAVNQRQHQQVVINLLARINDLLKKPLQQQDVRLVSLEAQVGRSEYVRQVKQALAHIQAGDIYQINLTYPFKAKSSKPMGAFQAYQIYGQLRQLFPTALSVMAHEPQGFILSVSPERFCSLHQQIARLEPMKGTRPRGQTARDDKRLWQQLRDSQKEKAELLMVTDLARNDLGRVCELGTIKVRQLRRIEKYKKVFQASAVVEGKLARKYDALDLLEAVFPSGSVTGCPKLKAMSLIDQIEQYPRGIYTGAIGYMIGKKNMDFNVAIRTIRLSHRDIDFHVGSGIVADSNPEAEYEETLVKATAMQEAIINVLGKAHGKN